MKQKKKKRSARSLSTETMIIFLKTISTFKKRVSLSSCVAKIQIKNTHLRSTRAVAILRYLQKKSYIRLERNMYPLLTEKGRLYLENIAQKQKTHWDRRFRIIFFAGIQASRNSREYMRAKIKNYGFMQLERGVWIYPYVCDAFLRLLELEYHLQDPLMYAIAQDNDSLSFVRKHFRLR